MLILSPVRHRTMRVPGMGVCLGRYFTYRGPSYGHHNAAAFPEHQSRRSQSKWDRVLGTWQNPRRVVYGTDQGARQADPRRSSACTSGARSDRDRNFAIGSAGVSYAHRVGRKHERRSDPLCQIRCALSAGLGTHVAGCRSVPAPSDTGRTGNPQLRTTLGIGTGVLPQARACTTQCGGASCHDDPTTAMVPSCLRYGYGLSRCRPGGVALRGADWLARGTAQRSAWPKAGSEVSSDQRVASFKPATTRTAQAVARTGCTARGPVPFGVWVRALAPIFRNTECQDAAGLCRGSDLAARRCRWSGVLHRGPGRHRGLGTTRKRTSL